MPRSFRPNLSVLAGLLCVAGYAGLAPTARAQTATAWTYQGVLDLGGAPANGPHDFSVAIFATQNSSTALASTTVANVLVENGRVNLAVDFGSATFPAFTGGPRWVEIRVRPSGAGPFVTLSRQPLNAAPRALSLDGLVRDAAGQFGINTSTPLARIDIQAGANSDGVSEGRPLAIQWWNGGFRHWLTTRHQASAGNGNAFVFWLNNATTAGGSSAPGTGNLAAGAITGGDLGRLGVGTVEPLATLHARAAAPGLRLESTAGNRYFHEWRVESDDSLRLGIGTTGAATTVLTVGKNGEVGIGAAPAAGARLTVAGNIQTQVLTITGGSDIAEPFDVNLAEGGEVRPGMVVCIDPERTGELRVADRPYDHSVAGIVSGANGVNPGLTLTQAGTVADGKHPVAMTGRVWALADASRGAIRPGDLLTTSATAGHAMRATDRARAGGAILGKAMSALPDGKGYVLVLVNLQ